jgi:ribosome maturation factor RimP
MKLSNKSQALHDLIAPAVAACGVDLWGIEFLPQGKRSLLRIYIDKAVDENVEPILNEDGEVEQGRGIGVQDCVLVTQQVGAMLDVHDPISGEYALKCLHQVGIVHFSNSINCLLILGNKWLYD